jgi:hypothetical protein
MQTISRLLRPAQDEVHRTAHDQDLIEIPKRAKLDREADALRANQPYKSPEPVSVPGEK